MPDEAVPGPGDVEVVTGRADDVTMTDIQYA
jgi:hypothetical protein